MRTAFALAALTLVASARAQVCPVPPSRDLVGCYPPAVRRPLGQVVACLDPAIGIPRWASAWFVPGQRPVPRTVCDWRRTPPLPSPDAYAGSGYDRGHLIAFADIGCSREAAAATCQTGNIIPQPSAANRGPWAALEERLRSYALTVGRGAPVLFVAGPVLGGTARLHSGIAVPRGVWKAAVIGNAACTYQLTFGEARARLVSAPSVGLRTSDRTDCFKP